jgi:hypothetical protein
MTQRERRLALILGVVAVVGGLLLAYQLILRPLNDYSDTIASLDDDIIKTDKLLQGARKDKARLDRWRLMSLPVDPAHPTDPALATREYRKYLGQLMFKNTILAESFNPMDTPRAPTQPGKPRPAYTALHFSIRARASLGNFVRMLDEFQQTPLLHKIKSLTIARVEGTAAARKNRDDVVTVQMMVEALVVNGAERPPSNRPTNLLGIDQRLLALDALTRLRRGPAGIALAPLSPTGPLGKQLLAVESPARTYADIARKNIFQGPPADDGKDPLSNPGGPIDVTRYTFLTDIVLNDKEGEAFYYIRTSNRWTRLRESRGFNTFIIKDERGEEDLVKGTVLKIESRDVYFRAGDNYFVIHIGQNFDSAMRHPLSPAQVETLGLAGPSSKGLTSTTDQ